jgi:membrane protease YdiL (CAAX protease family)
LRGFGPVGLLAIAVIVLTGNVALPLGRLGVLVLPVGALLTLAWAKASHTPWRAIGFVRPGSWLAGLAVGLVFGVAFKVLMKAIVMPLLGADPVNHAYHYLTGNTAALPLAILTMTVTGGVGEETLYRGFLFERLGRLLGHGAPAKAVIVIVTALWFASGHLIQQGLPGAEQAVFTGLTFGALYAVTGRLWTPICAHAAFDLTALAMIYFDAETRFAHLVFP